MSNAYLSKKYSFLQYGQELTSATFKYVFHIIPLAKGFEIKQESDSFDFPMKDEAAKREPLRALDPNRSPKPIKGISREDKEKLLRSLNIDPKSGKLPSRIVVRRKGFLDRLGELVEGVFPGLR